jgi:dipeptidyl aminopeptidase/acylaminoacyl peptidase
MRYLLMWLATVLASATVSIGVAAAEPAPAAPAVTLAAASAAPPLAAGTDVTPLPVDVAVGLKNLSAWPPQVSADGKLLAFVVIDGRTTAPFLERRMAETGLPSASLGAQVWIQDRRTGRVTRLESGRSFSWAPVWSPDGQTLAFLSDREGAVHLHLWTRASGAVRRASAAVFNLDPSYGEALLWSNDGSQIFAAFSSEAAPPPAAPSLRVPADVTQVDPNALLVQTFSSLTPPPPIDEQQPKFVDFGFVDVQSGEVTHFARQLPALNCALSPAHDFLACNLRELANDGRLLNRFAIFDTRNGEELLHAVAADNTRALFAWSPDGRYLLFDAHTAPGVQLFDARTGDARALQWPEGAAVYSARWDAESSALYAQAQSSLWRIPVDGQGAAQQRALPTGGNSVLVTDSRNSAWHPRGRAQLFFRMKDTKSAVTQLYRFDFATGKTRTVYQSAPNHLLAAVQGETGKSTLLFQVTTTGSNNDLWQLDVAAVRPRAKAITNIDPEYNAHALGKWRLIDFKSTRGQDLQGLLLLPAHYQPGRRYPTVVWVYGGEDAPRRNVDGRVFDFQVLSTRGYAVFYPAVPVRAGWAVDDIAGAVEPSVQRLIALGIADPQRFAVMGNSYGGYSVKMLLVQTSLFRAAITSAGTGGNLFTTYTALDDQGRDVLGLLNGGQLGMPGNPWHYREEFWKNSPFFAYDKIKTPLLEVVGLSEDRLFIDANNETFVALRQLSVETGVEVEYVRYGGEGHSLLGFAHQVDFWNRRLDFLARHLGLRLDAHGAVIFDGAQAAAATATSAESRH